MKQRLADIAEVRAGYSFRGKVLDDAAGQLAVVQMKDVSDVGSLDPAACLHIAEEPAHRRHLIQVGDVLLQSRGSKFPAGLVDVPIHGIAALGLHILRPGDRLLPAYLAWVMNHPATREDLRGIARGSYIPFLSKTDVEQITIPVPSLGTQQKITEVVRLRRKEQDLLTALDRLETEYIAAATWRAAIRK